MSNNKCFHFTLPRRFETSLLNSCIVLVTNCIGVVIKLSSRGLEYKDGLQKKERKIKGGRIQKKVKEGRRKLYVYQVPDIVLSILICTRTL